MKVRPVIAVGTGVGLYAILSVAWVFSSNVLGNCSNSDGTIEVVALLLAWFLPALAAGAMTRSKPVVVGGVLGALLLVYDYIAGLVVMGPDWALATLIACLTSKLITVVSAIVFTYAGWKIQKVNFPDAKHNVA